MENPPNENETMGVTFNVKMFFDKVGICLVRLFLYWVY